MRIPKEVINEVLSKIRIEELIGEYLPIEKKGKDFVCTCPFHDDHNPSMHISTSKQLFKCFVCNEGGDALSFVQKYENISFVEAVKKLAMRVNIAFDYDQYKQTIKVDPSVLRSETLLKDLEEYSNYSLFTEEGKDALTYLREERLLSDEAIRKYNIGFIPSTEKMVNFLEKKGYTQAEITAAGVLKINEHSFYSFLGGRISFPIHNTSSSTVGFSCRILPGKAGAKYINSSESSVFTKGKLLFNYANARNEALSKKEIVVMEGQMNPIKASMLGVNNCVAQMGTALTKEQINLLRKLKVPVKLMYDGDAAGQLNTLKNYFLLRDAGITVRTVLLPEGMDPDELIDKDPELFLKYYEQRGNILDYRLSQVIENPDNFEDVEKYTRGFLQELKDLNDPLLEDFYFKKLSDKTGFTVEALKQKMSFIKSQNIHASISKQEGTNKKDVPKKEKLQKKVLIKFSVKPKLKASAEVEKKYDRLRSNHKVLIFDKDIEMDRKDLLRKYIEMKGTMLESTVTLVNYDMNIDYAAIGICQAATKEIATQLNIPYSNIDYIAYLHKDTNHPHLHIQIFQKETYLEQYDLSSKLVNQLQKVIDNALEELEKVNVDPTPNVIAM